MAKEKHNLFNLFYRTNRDGKGVKKEKKRPLDFPSFFVTLPRRFSKLVSINLLLIVGCFPLAFPLVAATGYLSTPSTAPSYDMFSAVYNLYKQCPSPAVSSLWGILGVQVEVRIPNTATYVFYALGLLIVLTIGLLSAGVAYLLRNLVRGESVSPLSDFFYAVKRNFRQAMIVGVLDSFFLFMLAWDIVTFYTNLGSGNLMGILFLLSLCMAVVYFFMRFYIYLLMVTFDLSIFKIFKNALIFSLLGIWRNLTATIGIAVVLLATMALASLFFPLGMVIPVVCGFSLCCYMATYAAYDKIKTYMIDPYYKDEGEESGHSYFDEDDAPVFRDDVSQ